MATTCQSSYPLNSENASPFGVCTVYLSCAEIALPPKTASTTAMAAPAAADVARTLRGVGNDGVLDMIILVSLVSIVNLLGFIELRCITFAKKPRNCQLCVVRRC